MWRRPVLQAALAKKTEKSSPFVPISLEEMRRNPELVHNKASYLSVNRVQAPKSFFVHLQNYIILYYVGL